MSHVVSWDRLGSEAKRFTQQMTSFTDSPCMCRPGPSEVMLTFAGQSGSEAEQKQQGWAKLWIILAWSMGTFFLGFCQTNKLHGSLVFAEKWKHVHQCHHHEVPHSLLQVPFQAWAQPIVFHKFTQLQLHVHSFGYLFFDKSIHLGRYHGFQYLMLVTFSTTTSAAFSHDIMLIFSRMYWTFLRLARICSQFQQSICFRQVQIKSLHYIIQICYDVDPLHRSR